MTPLMACRPRSVGCLNAYPLRISAADASPTTTKQAESELLALGKQVSGLRLHVGKMSKTALDAMGIDRAAPISVSWSRWRRLHSAGWTRLRAQPANGEGRPRKGRAERITTVAAEVF